MIVPQLQPARPFRSGAPHRNDNKGTVQQIGINKDLFYRSYSSSRVMDLPKGTVHSIFKHAGLKPEV